jgi:hypothetical protein
LAFAPPGANAVNAAVKTVTVAQIIAGNGAKTVAWGTAFPYAGVFFIGLTLIQVAMVWHKSTYGTTGNVIVDDVMDGNIIYWTAALDPAAQTLSNGSTNFDSGCGGRYYFVNLHRVSFSTSGSSTGVHRLWTSACLSSAPIYLIFDAAEEARGVLNVTGGQWVQGNGCVNGIVW